MNIKYYIASIVFIWIISSMLLYLTVNIMSPFELPSIAISTFVVLSSLSLSSFLTLLIYFAKFIIHSKIHYFRDLWSSIRVATIASITVVTVFSLKGLEVLKVWHIPVFLVMAFLINLYLKTKSNA